MTLKLFYNLIGTISDKLLVVYIAIILLDRLGLNEFGKWSVYYQFALLFYDFIYSPQLTLMSINYTKSGKDSFKLYKPYYYIIVSIIIIILYYTFFSNLQLISIVEIGFAVILGYYNYSVLFLRFEGKDLDYFIASLLKLTLFIIFIELSYKFTGSISYSTILIAIFIAYLFVLLYSYKKQNILLRGIENNIDRYFFFSNSLYGASTSNINGSDKFAIKYLTQNLELVGAYSFITYIVTLPTIVIEAIKKSVIPNIYKNIEKKGNENTWSIKYLIIIGFLIQLITPVIVYYLLVETNIINLNIDSYNITKYDIIILSFGYAIYTFYHYFNPFYFYNKRTDLLLLITLMCFIGYLICVTIMENSLSNFILAKASMLIFVSSLTIIGNVYLKRYVRKD